MSVYHKFDDADIIHYSLSTSPKSTFASGTSGWRGSTGTSGSISMYGGIRSRETTGTALTIQPTYLLDTHSIDGKIALSASYPFTGSLSYVQVVNRELDRDTEVHNSFWGDEHFQPIMRLYDYYSRTNAEYMTSSYDHYALYSEAGSSNKVVYSGSFGPTEYSVGITVFNYSAGTQYFQLENAPTDWPATGFVVINNETLIYDAILGITLSMNPTSTQYHASRSLATVPGIFSYNQMSSSFTIEAMVKPLSVSGSAENYTIASRTGMWSLFITGSDGRVAFSASDGSGLILTSSTSVIIDRWQHIAYKVGEGSGSFLIDMNDAGQHPVTGSIDAAGLAPIVLYFDEQNTSHSFHGLAYETKVWSTERSFAQLSASFDRTLIQSGSSDLLVYSRANDGPHSTDHTFAKGSGSFDYSDYSDHGEIVNFNTRQAPIWHPNDNADFIVPKANKRNSIDEMRVIHVPSMFYGRSIATGSVRLVCNSYLSSSLQRVLVDDGRGGLYLSGSATSSSLDTREEYQGVQWNKVGNIFYSEGVIAIKDPALLDFGAVNTDSPWQRRDLLEVSFAGLESIPTKVFMCRINGAEANCSFNESFSSRNENTGKLEANMDKPVTWITSVGIYNKDRKLVAVAKLASPIRNREKDKLNIRLKLDF